MKFFKILDALLECCFLCLLDIAPEALHLRKASTIAAQLACLRNYAQILANRSEHNDADIAAAASEILESFTPVVQRAAPPPVRGDPPRAAASRCACSTQSTLLIDSCCGLV